MSPWCVFTEPELARVGFTAAQARERFQKSSRESSSARALEVHCALFEGSSEGLIEIVTVHGRIVGGHVIASRASEVINEIALAVRFSVSIEELAACPMYTRPSPAVSDGLHPTSRFFGCDAERLRQTRTPHRLIGYLNLHIIEAVNLS